MIAVIVNSADSSISCRIGMREMSGVVDYVDGSGNKSHIFTIDSAGEYTVYVENRSSSKTLEVTGSAMYPN